MISIEKRTEGNLKYSNITRTKSEQVSMKQVIWLIDST